MNDSSLTRRGATEAPRADQAVDATSSEVVLVRSPRPDPEGRPAHRLTLRFRTQLPRQRG